MGLLADIQGGVLADRIFSAMDLNGNGAVDFPEYLAYISVMIKGDLEEKAEQTYRLITFGKDRNIEYCDLE